MCGIAVLFANDTVKTDSIRRMTDVISHRGPDGEGHVSLFEGRLWLGHRRLAIIDLTATGHQPMSYREDRYWITFNGEIYNYIELREVLEGKGHQFRSDSDTEVLAAAYAEWGKDCLHRLNGMWAFVIADTVTGEVFGARDRFGVKPFYFAADGDRLACASEIKQLREAGFGTGRAERREVANFIVYGRVNIERETLFEGINQLLPGEACSWNIAEGAAGFKVYRYYRPVFNPEMRADGRLEEYQERFNQLLHDAVRVRLRSDVSVGTCLSGGLDSSAITLLKQELITGQSDSHRQKTFTSCFQEREFDEWEYAAAVVSHAGVENYRVFPAMDSLLDELPALSWHQEEPLQSTSVFAQWNVMRLARQQGIKVLLDGQGADEIMAGYHYYIPQYFASLLRAGRVYSFLREAVAMNRTGMLFATRGILRTSLQIPYFFLGLNKFRSMGDRSLLREEDAVLPPCNIAADFQQHQYKDIFGSLQTLLRYEDRNSMAFSIEARTPFLDYRLVELFLEIPGEYKLRGGWTKPFLRQAMMARMPDKVRLRVDKKGFVTPETAWARKNHGRIKEILLAGDYPVGPWIDRNKLSELLASSANTSREMSLLWRLLSVTYWMQAFNIH